MCKAENRKSKQSKSHDFPLIVRIIKHLTPISNALVHSFICLQNTRNER